jgi:Fe-S-cluster containining protein
MDCRELIEKGICKADCCGPIIDDNGDFVPCNEETMKCIHLDSELKCDIYESRPSVCKEYGTIPELQCPYIDLRGKLRTPGKQRRFQRIINHNVDDSLRRMKRRFL